MRSDKFITYVELRVNPEFISDVLVKAVEARDFILLEAGCELFNLTRKNDEPNTLVIFAVYTSKTTYEWHLEQNYIKSFFGYLVDKLVVPPTVTYLEEV